MNDTDNRKEVKRKFALWIKQSTIDMVEGIYKEDNCSSRSEFIEKAINRCRERQSNEQTDF